MKSVAERVDAERRRHVRKGFDASHDDRHTDGSIAGCANLILCPRELLLFIESLPNQRDRWEVTRALHVREKHPDRRRQLVIAASLLHAEIERLDRRAKRKPDLH